MGTLLLGFLFVWLVGMIPFLVTYWLTRSIRAGWLRQLPRALVLALTFAPSFWSEGSCNGIPLPAIVILFGGWHSLSWHQIFILVVEPVAFCFSIGYALACFVSYVLRRSKNAA